MYRDKIKELKRWKEESPRKPLIVQGARQVGKT
jgi:predicted AAA+ superfamily ATPase